ncbi:AraC family transcriptional regulator [Verminephrobacter aporrectodeae subsp. tuberculatae]|uniref:helix-turn-helix transcriptional regulator n=1 Tax=Verminephrobacter aporrectodeae TaxID=1110389 RepID=UPI0022445EA7|nr:AraC family transcriptional regulator [Verminephrobacter aporrectodeae]MCW8198185.1 AraC family transcriptional regulator [Verminephrobacter aporrectodeae subsp. tuberculatae]
MNALKFLRQIRWESGDGICMSGCELLASEDAVLPNPIPEDGLLLGLTLFGAAESGHVAQPQHDFAVPPDHCWALAVQQGSLLEGRYAAGARIAGVSFFLSRCWLLARTAGDDVMAQLLSYCGQPMPRKAPLSAPLRSHALRLLYSSYCGEMGRLFLAARAHDLLLGLIDSHRNVPGGPMLHTPTGLLRMSRARDILEARLSDPPEPAELAKLAGTSVSALRKEFKAAFGLPVAAYARKRRLEQAHLSLERGLSVTAVAHQFDYDSPANFSTAFKRQFGYPPSELRVR